ncbi:MAG: flavin reductase [Firmicutes bacterium]|nr:flavin reductase [Bacillota bacterium]MBQ3200103.1 flavin reductase [Bacillota bacterium]
MDRKVLHKLSYGLYVVTTTFEGRMNGQIADAVMQVNAAPKQTVALSLNNDNFTTELVKKSGKIALSILSQNYDPQIITNFGMQSGRNVDKFAVFPPQISASGLPYYTGSGFCGWLEGTVIEQQTVGSHTIFVIEVTEGALCDDLQPLIYADYLNRKRQPQTTAEPVPQTEVKAAEPAAGDEPTWRCTICGHTVQGDLDENYRCPLCGVGRELFERI